MRNKTINYWHFCVSKFAILSFALFLSACNQGVQATDNDDKAVKKDKQAQLSQQDIKSKTQPKTPTSPAKEEIVKKKDDGFDFSYKDLGGKDVHLSDFRGKWVVVNFWATWCPPCRKEIPDFVKFKKLYGEKIEILGINNEDAETDKIQDFVFEYEINYPILRADVYNPKEFTRKNTRGLPTTVIFNPQGVEVSKRVGPMHFDDLTRIMGFNKSP